MSNIREELDYLERSAAMLREEAAEAERAFATLNSVSRLKALENCPVSLYRYAKQVVLHPETRDEARRVMRVMGGQWVKSFDELTGQFAFDQPNVVANWRARIIVAPSASCVIEKREVQVATTQTTYVPVGNCGSILDDE